MFAKDICPILSGNSIIIVSDLAVKVENKALASNHLPVSQLVWAEFKGDRENHESAKYPD
jgi:hypothetical protein